MRKFLLPTFLGLCLLIIKMTMSSSSGGITGVSSAGCSCHGSAGAATVLTVTGFPTNYVNNQAYPITFTITNASKVAGGFDLAVSAGNLSGAISGQTAITANLKEIYHTAPKNMTAGVVSWTFTWTAPASGSTAVSVTYAGNAVNLLNGSLGDQYNIGTKTVNGTVTPLSVTASNGVIACNGGTATIGCTGAGGTAPYQYAKNGGTYQTTNTFTGNVAGTYTITVKDATNATASTVKTINQPTAIAITPSHTNVSCNGASNGTASVSVSGGTPGYTYSWAPLGGSSATATNLLSGSYTCTVTDANACTKTQTFSITQPPALNTTPSQTMVSCPGGSNATASVVATGGAGSYTYSWSPFGGTGSQATNLSAGNYTCTVTDANSCTKTQTFTIAQPVAFNLTPVQVNVSCNGGSNGSVSLNPSGGTPSYSYNWLPSGGSGVTASNLVAGTYTVTLTDGNACTKTQSFTITQPPVINVSSSQTNVTCFGGNDGTATATGSGGVPNYTYSWAPSGGTLSTAYSLTSGTYTCTVSDAALCTKTTTITITQPPLVNVTANLLNNLSCSGSAMSLYGDVPSGNPGYSYTWTGGITNGQYFTLSTPTTYTVTGVSSVTGCTDTDVITVTPTSSNNLAQSSGNNTVSVSGSSCATVYQIPGLIEKHTTPTCQLIATIEQPLSSPALTFVTSCVNVLTNVPVFNNQPYVPRYYSITPQSQGQAYVTLYFTHAELVAYNNYIITNSSNFPLLNYPNTVPQNGDQVTNASITKIDGTLGTAPGIAIPILLLYDASMGVWKTTFTVNSFSSFYLHATNPFNTPLDVNLVSFTGVEKENSHHLRWTVENEKEIMYYTIMHSTDGIHFDQAGKVAAKNNNAMEQDYTFINTSVKAGHNYYQLQTTDVLGITKTISKVIDIPFGKMSGDPEIQIYPNPVNNKLLSFSYFSLNQGKLHLEVCDASGRVLWSEDTTVSTSLSLQHQVRLDHLQRGTYWLKITQGKHKSVRPFTMY